MKVKCIKSIIISKNSNWTPLTQFKEGLIYNYKMCNNDNKDYLILKDHGNTIDCIITKNNFPSYFITIEEWRDKLINDIINDSNMY